MSVPNNTAEGYVTNEGLSNDMCLDVPRSYTVGFFGCHYTGGTQFIEYSVNSELRKDEYCFDYSQTLKLFRCHGKKGSQEWILNFTTNQFVHKTSQKCLSVDEFKKAVIVETCDEKSQSQKWHFQYLYDNKSLK